MVVSKAVIFYIYLLYSHPKKVDSVERKPINALLESLAVLKTEV